MNQVVRIEKLDDVPKDAVKTQAEDAVNQSAVEFQAIKNEDGTWTTKKVFVLEDPS